MLSLEYVEDRPAPEATAPKVAAEDHKVAASAKPCKPELGVAPEVVTPLTAPQAVVESAFNQDVPAVPFETRILVGHQAVDAAVLDRDVDKAIETS